MKLGLVAASKWNRIIADENQSEWIFFIQLVPYCHATMKDDCVHTSRRCFNAFAIRNGRELIRLKMDGNCSASCWFRVENHFLCVRFNWLWRFSGKIIEYLIRLATGTPDPHSPKAWNDTNSHEHLLWQINESFQKTITASFVSLTTRFFRSSQWNTKLKCSHFLQFLNYVLDFV